MRVFTVRVGFAAMLLVAGLSVQSGERCEARIVAFGEVGVPHHPVPGVCEVLVEFDLPPSGEPEQIATTSADNFCRRYYREVHRAVLTGSYRAGNATLRCEHRFRLEFQMPSSTQTSWLRTLTTTVARWLALVP